MQIDESTARFVEYVSALTVRLSPDLTLLPVDQAAAEIYARFQKVTTAAGKRDILATQLDSERHNLQAATITIGEMQSALAALCAEAECSSADDLPQIERHSEEKQTMDQKIESLETQLRRLSAGQSITDFLAYCAITRRGHHSTASSPARRRDRPTQQRIKE